MARGAGRGGFGGKTRKISRVAAGLSGRGGMSGRGGRGSMRNARNTSRRMRSASSRARKRGSRGHEADARLDASLNANTEGVKNKPSMRLKNIRNKVRNAKKIRANHARNRDGSRKNRLSEQKEIKQEIDNFAGDIVKGEYQFLYMESSNFAPNGVSPNGIYAGLKTGQRTLLGYAGPQIETGFRAGFDSKTILNMASKSHPAVDQAIGQTVKDLVQLGQNIRDSLNYAVDSD